MKIHNEKAGFTLVELLVVIAIIVILAGAAIVVINPAQQKAKANEALMRSNFSKICMAVAGCGALKDNPTQCNEFTEIGVNDPSGNPPGSYYYKSSETSTRVVWAGRQNGNGSVDCRYLCIYYFDTGTFIEPYYYDGTCVAN